MHTEQMLPRGVTGFWSTQTEPPPILDEKTFRRMCYTLARENGGVVTEVDTDSAARNFYFAQVRRYDVSIFILQNIHVPYAAFAQRDTFGGFVLTGQPEWLRLPESPVHFLGLDELNQNWRGLCENLTSEELEQIRCWRPQTVGEIIFNHWD